MTTEEPKRLLKRPFTWIVIALIVLGAIVALNSNPGEAALTLFRLLTQWQVLLFILLMVFGPKFGAALAVFLRDRDVKGKWRDTEIQVSRSQALPAPEEAPAAALVAPTASEPAGSIGAPQSSTPQPTAPETSEEELKKLRLRERYWMFRFFECFLVPRTKRFLHAVQEAEDISRTKWNNKNAATWFWMTNTATADYVAVISALIQLGLIVREPGAEVGVTQYAITPLGRDYVAFSMAANPGFYSALLMDLFGPPPEPTSDNPLRRAMAEARLLAGELVATTKGGKNG